ncbi:MAG: ribonuclease III [Sedimentisphaerales bacterium]|nr:ribonuclease III [Sedimentisphaerales bacterium]
MDDRMAELEEFQNIINYHFKDISLLDKALRHASAADRRLDSNERLEFLGDSVLGLTICQELFERFPEYLEGELTKVKSMIVSRRTCARVAKHMRLTDFLIMGKGMSSQRDLPTSCPAGAFESLIGAIYMDGGYESSRAFLLRWMGDLLDEADAKQPQENYKSMLQQYAQRFLNSTPIYEMLDEKGPDHSKCFEIGVIIERKRFESAWGPSKKESEQLAAFKALKELGQIPEEVEFKMK